MFGSSERAAQPRNPHPARVAGRAAVGLFALSAALAPLALPLATLLFAPTRTAAQEDPEGLALECAQGIAGTELHRWCLETALAARAVQGEVGMVAAGGSDVPGTASTVGRRIGPSPRISLALRLGGARVGVPDVRQYRSGPAPEASFLAPSLQAQAVMGVFEGFAPAPTVSGLLALDLVAGGSFVFLPEDRGFDGGAAGYLLGARIGVLRESFTLPGVSVAVTRRGLGDVRLGGDADAGEVDADLDVTSLRATVGKDFLRVGILGGVGWDRVTGDVRIRARAEPLDVAAVEGTAVSGDFRTTRFSWFGGATLTFLILQVSAEVGWAEGLDAVSGRAPGGYDPTESRLFGGLSLRVTF